MGVLGAVVMPHNMYLHSEVIQNRQWKADTEAETRRLLRYEFVDTLVAMLAGMAINMAMVIVAAAVFHRNGVHVSDLSQASADAGAACGDIWQGCCLGLLSCLRLVFLDDRRSRRRDDLQRLHRKRNHLESPGSGRECC